MGVSNLADIEFKRMVIRMLNKLSENYNKREKEHRKHKNNYLEMKNTISEMKKSPERINCRLDEGKDKISNLEDKLAEHTQSEKRKYNRIFLK